MTDHPVPSRRTALLGLGTGVAAAVAASPAAQAQGAGGAAGATAAAAPRDPTTRYPKPPFPKQEQPWPGLASRMNPRPDHGEESYKGSGRLAGRKALVTGGDSGIGRAAVIAFAREVIALIKAAGRKGVALPGDIRDEAFCRKLVEDAARELGGLDILVNNAAFQHPRKSITDISNEEFDQTFKTNVYAPFWITKAAMAHLKPGASIINTTSINAADPGENLLAYASTKAVNANFTQSLAKQLGPKGIRVNAVAPGPVWTPLQPSGGQFPDELPEFGSKAAMGRPGQPAELASLYVLLASNEATFSTGQIFGADGGRGVS